MKSRQEDFTRNWFRERNAKDSTPGLIHEVRAHGHEGIRVIARVPNLLCYMAILKRSGKPLPDGRAVLYQEIARAYLDGIDRAYHLSPAHGHVAPFPPETSHQLLPLLAAAMQARRADAGAEEEDEEQNKQPGDGHLVISQAEVAALLVPEVRRLVPNGDPASLVCEFLGHIARRSGLLLPRGQDTEGDTLYGFTHLSFLEFFAACYVLQKLEDIDNKQLEEADGVHDPVAWERDHPSGPLEVTPASLAEWAGQPAWSETLFFLAELRGGGKPDLCRRLLRQLFPALHSAVPVPAPAEDDETTQPLLPLPAAALALKLARDQHLKVPAVTRRVWLQRLWEAHLCWPYPQFLARGWHPAPLLLSHPAGEEESLAALRAAAARYPNKTCLDLADSTGLKAVDQLPDSLTALLLGGCTTLSTVNDLPDSLTALYLRGCTGLSAVDRLPVSLTALFLTGCTRLTTVDRLPPSLDTLSLEGCTGLSAVDGLPASVTRLSLAGCAGLSAVDHLPAFLTELNLNNCKGLNSLGQLPASLTLLFLGGCTGLRTVDQLPASLTTLCLDGCTGLEGKPLPPQLANCTVYR